ncbi:Isoprenylcysteine carboxyl methyltransferase [Crepidotus variabilis]|uniref:Protein-S-isoprenylcysteine O-methyltransferase n=1 Tax=Crepidotus variabilis TaxID=179855 RepID=A0A9P6E8A3_9AGAR|nr:Isoprenylcysteine carboxyl methyltransferase [Crepidotus variabilis]
MIQSSTRFAHNVVYDKVEGHSLVTDGVYGYFRHPSYAGSFYWSLGMQMVLQNPLSFILFCVVMRRFSITEFEAEEDALIKYFGND